MEGMPIIRMEIQRMKYGITAVLTEHQAKIDTDIRKAVEQYCTEENIAALVNQYAENAINAAVREEVEKYFKYGNGRKTVAEQVKKTLKDD